MGTTAGDSLTKGAFPQRIAVDANFLVAHASPATSPEDRARIDLLFAQAEKAKATIIIPMPALAEFLVGADVAGIEILNKLERRTFVQPAPFDRAAAFECSLLDRAALGGSNDKKDGTDQPWQKIKVDRQLVAIAKARGAQLIISADRGVRNNALRIGMPAVTVQELELPESAKQIKLELVPPVRASRLDAKKSEQGKGSSRAHIKPPPLGTDTESPG